MSTETKQQEEQADKMPDPPFEAVYVQSGGEPELVTVMKVSSRTTLINSNGWKHRIYRPFKYRLYPATEANKNTVAWAKKRLEKTRAVQRTTMDKIYKMDDWLTDAQEPTKGGDE